jgi:hypothetical protein
MSNSTDVVERETMDTKVFRRKIGSLSGKGFANVPFISAKERLAYRFATLIPDSPDPKWLRTI